MPLAMLFSQLTIRQRLPLYISVSALFILVIEGYFIYQYSVRFCETEFRERISQRLEQADSLITRDPEHPIAALKALPPGNLPDEKILYADDNHRFVLPSAIDTSDFDQCKFCFAHIGERDYGVRHDPNDHHTLVVSAIDRYGQSKLRNLRTGIVCGVLIGILLIALATWLWVKKMLKPIAEKISTARNIEAKSLNLRLDVKNHRDELGQLALTFNEMLDRIEQGFRSQQQFLRSASHEMRTPLTAITAEVDLALMQARAPRYYQEALQNIRTRAENLNELVAQLLLLTKVEALNTFSDQPCAADEVLLSALRTLQVKYGDLSQNIQLQLETTNSAEATVYCDPVVLQAAFLNLLDNAMKYGNGEMIAVRLFSHATSVCLEVADRGLGIAPEDAAHLFEPFYRSPRSAHLPGIGLGLSLVKSIAEKYGGSVQVRSEQGKGTTATLFLPLHTKKI
jgi:two-component system, OmpR family, sensor histidine kinase ArlS